MRGMGKKGNIMKMYEVDVRYAKKEDIDIVYQMICELEKSELDKTKFYDVFLRNIERSDVFYFVAEEENNIVGFLSVHIQELLHHNGSVAEVQELFVYTANRNKSIGRKLLDEAKKTAKEENCLSLEVSCNSEREKAHIFYEREGMEKSHFKFTYVP